MTNVTLSKLTKEFEGKADPSVDHIDLEIESGKLTALLGPSGCGKTTTMRMIAGLLRPTSGDIKFDGKSIVSIAPERRGAVMVFQNYLLFPYMTIRENVSFGLKMRGVSKTETRQRVGEMLDLVQLPGLEDRMPKQLSGGQQQRVALARALIVKPKVLLLDEPLSNLDAHLRDEMRELIRRLQGELKITTIFVTHDQEEAAVLSDKIALILRGSLQHFGTPEEYFERPGSVEIARFFGGVNFIPGTYDGSVIATSVGKFSAPRSSITSGEGVLTIRPEAVEISGEGGNSVQGRVVSHVYAGRYARFLIDVGNIRIEAVSDPKRVSQIADGEMVSLRFDPNEIWVLAQPTEGNGVDRGAPEGGNRSVASVPGDE